MNERDSGMRSGTGHLNRTQLWKETMRAKVKDQPMIDLDLYILSNEELKAAIEDVKKYFEKHIVSKAIVEHEKNSTFMDQIIQRWTDLYQSVPKDSTVVEVKDYSFLNAEKGKNLMYVHLNDLPSSPELIIQKMTTSAPKQELIPTYEMQSNHELVQYVKDRFHIIFNALSFHDQSVECVLYPKHLKFKKSKIVE